MSARTYPRRRWHSIGVPVGWLLGWTIWSATPAGVGAQQPVGGLTLADALRMAEGRSPELQVARAGVTRAEGQKLQARSEYFPQVFADLVYLRTLQSEFDSFGDGSSVDTPSSEPCPAFDPDPSRPDSERISALENALDCAQDEDPFAAFGNLPFGRPHRYSLDLSASQTVYSGGRVQAQNRLANATRRSAEIGVESARAQLTLEVAEAYFDAQLADRLLEISESTLALAERTLGEVRTAYELGEEAEFEMLRAQVTRNNQEPVVIQRRADRDLAHMRLRRLVGLPLDRSLALTSPLEDATSTPLASLMPTEMFMTTDTASQNRAAVRQSEEAVEVQEQQRKIARSQRLPSVFLSTGWTQVNYPVTGLPSITEIRPIWSVTARASVPLFTGGRIKGDVRVAEAGLDEARARLELTRELAAVDTRHALDQVQAAEAAWEASSGTVEQAEKAYQIAEIRFVEGIATQLDVMDARILLDQAGANRAQSARNLQVARLRVALLPFLPIAPDQAGLLALPTQVAPSQPAATPSQAQPTTFLERRGLVSSPTSPTMTGPGGGGR